MPKSTFNIEDEIRKCEEEQIAINTRILSIKKYQIDQKLKKK